MAAVPARRIGTRGGAASTGGDGAGRGDRAAPPRIGRRRRQSRSRRMDPPRTEAPPGAALPEPELPDVGAPAASAAPERRSAELGPQVRPYTGEVRHGTVSTSLHGAPTPNRPPRTPSRPESNRDIGPGATHGGSAAPGHRTPPLTAHCPRHRPRRGGRRDPVRPPGPRTLHRPCRPCRRGPTSPDAPPRGTAAPVRRARGVAPEAYAPRPTSARPRPDHRPARRERTAG